MSDSPRLLRFEGHEPGSRWAADDNTVYRPGEMVWNVGNERWVDTESARFYLSIDVGSKWKMFTDLTPGDEPAPVDPPKPRASRKSPPPSSSVTADSTPNPTPLES